jgi:membrane-associated phospholipid phosphatase
MRARLRSALVVAALLWPCGSAPAADEPAPPPRKSFREAFRTFAADGRYLVTFPARSTARGAWMTAGVLAGTALLIGRDDEIRREVVESDRRGPGRVATKLEPLGRLQVEAAGLGLFYAVGRWRGDSAAIASAATAFEAFLWTTIITSAAKGAFGRERPSEGIDAYDFFEDDTIFPSGHTSRSFAIAAVLADRHGRTAAFIGYPLAALVGLATVQQDTHWASDILAGAGLGLAIGKGIASRHPGPRAAPGGPGRRNPPGDDRATADSWAPRGAAERRRLAWRALPLPGGARVALSF